MGFENWFGNKNKRESENEKTQENLAEKGKGVTRRDFLKTGARAGAGLAVSLSGADKALAYTNKKFEKIAEPEKIAKEMLRVYETRALQKRIDPVVFTKDFYIAQQFQESRGEKESESSSGAKGVYQNKPESVVDAVKFLAYLKKITKNKPKDGRVDYDGPENISIETAQKVTDLFTKHADYGRAAGKLYLQLIHDEDSKYNNHPNPDVFKGKPSEQQQELLLVAYHDGPARRLNPGNASEEAKKYIKFVRKHMKNIADLRNRFEAAGLSRDLDYAILKILRELDRRENQARSGQVKDYWVAKIKEAQEGRRKYGRNQEPISTNEIRELFIKG